MDSLGLHRGNRLHVLDLGELCQRFGSD